MVTFQSSLVRTLPVLHVLEQEGGWHCGITVPRLLGTGFQMIGFSEYIYAKEGAVRMDGRRALATLKTSGHESAEVPTRAI